MAHDVHHGGIGQQVEEILAEPNPTDGATHRSLGEERVHAFEARQAHGVPASIVPNQEIRHVVPQVIECGRDRQLQPPAEIAMLLRVVQSQRGPHAVGHQVRIAREEQRGQEGGTKVSSLDVVREAARDDVASHQLTGELGTTKLAHHSTDLGVLGVEAICNAQRDGVVRDRGVGLQTARHHLLVDELSAPVVGPP